MLRLVRDVIDRLPQTGDKGIYLKHFKDKLIEHYDIDHHGQDMPENPNRKWCTPNDCALLLFAAAGFLSGT